MLYQFQLNFGFKVQFQLEVENLVFNVKFSFNFHPNFKFFVDFAASNRNCPPDWLTVQHTSLECFLCMVIYHVLIHRFTKARLNLFGLFGTLCTLHCSKKRAICKKGE